MDINNKIIISNQYKKEEIIAIKRKRGVLFNIKNVNYVIQGSKFNICKV